MPPRLYIRANRLEWVIPRWSIGLKAQTFIPPYQPTQCHNGSRNFTQASILYKKGGKSAKKDNSPSTAEKSSAVEDPYDFSTLETGIKKALSKLQDDLSKLRTGGRFNPKLLESVRVQLKKDSKSSFRLGDLAQVIPKGGKSITVLVGEADHVKPIISAIQGSKELNLLPQQDSHHALQLNIPIPPPTKESRALALSAAGKAGEAANVGVRNARAVMQKRLRAMELNKTARPDDIRKGHKEMEKVVEKGNADIKKAVEMAIKAMESQ